MKDFNLWFGIGLPFETSQSSLFFIFASSIFTSSRPQPTIGLEEQCKDPKYEAGSRAEVRLPGPKRLPKYEYQWIDVRF